MVTLHGFRQKSNNRIIRLWARSSKRLSLLLAAVLAFTLVGNLAYGMFVSPSEEEETPLPAAVETQPAKRELPDSERGESAQTPPRMQERTSSTSSQGSLSGAATDLSDTKLRREIENIVSGRVQTRKRVSNTFARMSGQADKLKPVTLPTPSVVRCRASLVTNEISAGRVEKTLNLICWAFVASCAVAASVALLKIKKHTTST